MGDFVRYIFDYLSRTIILIASDPLFIGVSLLIIYMYKRIAKQVNKRSYRYKMEYTAVKDIMRGVAIGCFLSLALDVLDVRIPLDGNFVGLIPVAIVLILINPKWGCFSYVVPVAYVLYGVLSWVGFKVPFEIEMYKQLILLVGVLHIVEGILVIGCGAENTYEEPVQVGNRLIKGKKMTKYWPVPLIVFRQVGGDMTPLILYAFLGYGDIALGNNEKQKSHLTGSIVLLYGVLVTLIGIYGLHKNIFLPGVMMIMPMMHELIFKITLYIENVLNKKREDNP
ncbi:MAG: hypothetical protein ACRCTE_10325 [Cellulosilyticaceae bacterium]